MIESLWLKFSRGDIAKRFGWGLGDQALSSLTNFALSFVVTRDLGTEQLGAFALVFSTYLVVLSLSRVISTTPLVVRYSTVSHEEWRRGVVSATGSSLALGTGAGAVLLLVALVFLGGSTRSAYLALAVCLPGLMLQDAWRLAFFAQGKGFRAFANDFVWAVTLLPTIVVMDLSGTGTLARFVLAWGGAATLAGIAGMIQTRVVPLPGRVLAWWRQHRDLSAWYLLSYVMTQAAGQASTYLLVALTDLRALGAIQAVGVLFGPVRIAIMGVGLVATPEAARALRHSTQRLRTMVRLLSGGMVLVAALWGLFLLLVPESVGEALLRENWDVARPLMGLTALFMMATAAALGPQTGLAALEAARHSTKGRAWISLFVVALPSTTAVIFGGARGILYGGIVAEAAAAYIWYVFYRRAEARRDQEAAIPHDVFE